MWVSEVNSTQVKLMSKTLTEGMPDMAKMSELNQASILCNLHTRYIQNKIYVSFLFSTAFNFKYCLQFQTILVICVIKSIM